MSIVLMAAMVSETAPLRALMVGEQVYERGGVVMYLGRIGGVEVVLAAAGVGKVAAAMAATAVLLDRPEVTALINFGVAGALSPSLKRGDVVLAKAVAYHDVDVSAFGYAQGQAVGCPAQFETDKALCAAAVEGVQALGLPYQSGLVCSGDQFVHGAQRLARLQALYPYGLAVEMEAAAMAQVCHRFGLPFMAVRAVSDGADEAAKDEFLQGLALASEHCAQAVAQLLRHLP